MLPQNITSKAAASMREAELYHVQGDFASCLGCCEKVLQVNGNFIPALILAGVACLRNEKIEEALTFFSRALEIDSSCGPAIQWLSMAYRSLGETQKSLELAKRAVTLNPSDSFALHHLGLCELDAGNLSAAEAQFRSALRTSPKNSVIYESLASVLQRQERFGEAEEALGKAISLEPNSVSALKKLRQLFTDLGKSRSALQICKKIVTLEPTSMEARLWLTRAYREEGLNEQADEEMAKATELEPDSAQAESLLGVIYQTKGRIEEAEDRFIRSIEKQPNQGFAYLGLVTSRRITHADKDLIYSVEKLATSAALPHLSLSQLHYSLGKANEDLCEYESAMGHYDRANELAYQAKFGSRTYDKSDLTERYKRMTELFPGKLPGGFGSSVPPSPLPIFVVGMIRSGTTLLEQILSSHPAVGAAGEQKYWLENSSAVINPSGHELNRTLLPLLARKYLDILRKIEPNFAIVVDKMPQNFELLGLLHSIFPTAKILHMFRDPVDTALSIYATPNSARLGWAHSKSNIVFAYREYSRLMEHWRATIPNEVFMEIKYEELVQNQDAVTKEVIEFCGLEWSDACLAPHENGRAVLTPSVWQVRQPVYRTSVRRSEKFGPWLDELATLTP